MGPSAIPGKLIHRRPLCVDCYYLSDAYGFGTPWAHNNVGQPGVNATSQCLIQLLAPENLTVVFESTKSYDENHPQHRKSEVERREEAQKRSLAKKAAEEAHEEMIKRHSVLSETQPKA